MDGWTLLRPFAQKQGVQYRMLHGAVKRGAIQGRTVDRRIYILPAEAISYIEHIRQLRKQAQERRDREDETPKAVQVLARQWLDKWHAVYRETGDVRILEVFVGKLRNQKRWSAPVNEYSAIYMPASFNRACYDTGLLEPMPWDLDYCTLSRPKGGRREGTKYDQGVYA